MERTGEVKGVGEAAWFYNFTFFGELQGDGFSGEDVVVTSTIRCINREGVSGREAMFHRAEIQQN